MTVGDEIGIFDGNTCVGIGVVDSALLKANSNASIQLVAWRGDSSQSLPGFKIGNQMKFKTWASMSGYTFEAEETPTFTSGDGTFGTGQFSVLSLQIASPFVDIAASANVIDGGDLQGVAWGDYNSDG